MCLEWETTHVTEQLGAPKFLDIILRNNMGGNLIYITKRYLVFLISSLKMLAQSS